MPKKRAENDADKTELPGEIANAELDGSKFEKDIRGIHFLLFAVAAILLLVSNGMSETSPGLFTAAFWQQITLKDVVKELSLAFFIAGIISITIEAAARRENRRELQRHTRAINRNVFGAIFGVYLPRNVVDDITNIMLESKFLRLNYKIRYEFEVQQVENADRSRRAVMAIKARASYTIRNVTPVEQKYCVVLESEEPPLTGGIPVDKIEDVFINDKKITAVFSQGTNENSSEPSSHFTFAHEVSLDAGEDLNVILYHTLIRSLNDSELMYCATPSEDMTLEVKIAPEMNAFGPIPIHHGQLITVSSSQKEHIWKIPGPVLPYQGLYFWWRCIK